MVRRTTSVFVAALLVSGFFLLAISLSRPFQAYPVMDGPVTVRDNTPYLTFEGNYGGIVGRDLTILGNLQSSRCCIGFYLFTYEAYNAWLANNFEATNSSTSPMVYLPYSAIALVNHTSAHFSHGLPDEGYFLVFFNDNKSLWHSSSNSTSQVVANISLDYQAAPSPLLSTPRWLSLS